MARRLFTFITQGSISTIQELFQALSLPLEKEEIEALLETDEIDAIDTNQYNKCGAISTKDMMVKIRDRLSYSSDPVGRQQIKIALQAIRLTKETTLLAEELLNLARMDDQERNMQSETNLLK